MHIKPTVLAITLSFFLASIVFSNTAQAAVGRTAGSGDVSSAGEANYVVPIHVPDGINGLQPEFALAYGHRKSEGISAVGWGVSGLSVINRCAKTFAQDGDTKNVELTTSDRFCVDGVQLRLTSGTYGSAGSQYRSEIDTISKYIAGGTAGNGPAYFTVKHKNGLTYEYGNSADSRIESLASGFTTTALTWALNKISDRNGNEILFVYEDDGVPYGDYRIDYVTYRSNPGQGVAPGYKVDFKYLVQPIEDVDINYAAGGIIEDTKRLYQIDVLYTVASPDTVVRKYKLNYEANLSSANRSRLSSVEECAGYPLECLSATTFTYQDGTVALDSSEVATGTTITAGARMMPMDVNGDGRDDLVYASSSGKWAYQLSNGSGYDSAYITTINSTNSADAIITDHNSDGIDDILVPYSGGTWWAIHGSNTGVHLQTPVNTSAPDTTAAGDATSLDINGDGRDDLIWAEHYSSGGPSIRGRTRLSTGNGYSSSYTTVYQASSNTTFLGSSVFAGSYEQNKRKNFDVNGDGIHDVAIVTERTGGTRWEPWELQFTDVILGGGAGQYSVKSDTSNGLPIDINGDGYTDIAYRVYNGSLLYRLSNGKSFGVQTTGPSLANLNFNLAVAMDFNGDGMQDLVMPNTSTGTWHYLESEGDSFATAVDTTRSSAGVVDTYSVDHDGDGLADIGLKKTSGSNYTYAHRRHSGVKPDLMASATDGYGNSIAYSYASIAQSSYTKGTGAVFPNQDYVGPLQVVTSADISTGIGSNTYTETYTYSGALFNVQGRALSPFETVTIVDNRNNLKLTETYLREFPYRGRMSGRDFLQQNGTPIQVVTNTWSAKTGGSGNQNYHYPYISATLEKNYEVAGAFNGAQIDEVSSTMVVDTYGTRTSTTTTRTEKSTANGLNAGATYTEQVVHTGIIDQTLGWCLGKPTQTQWINSHTQSGGYGTQITRTKSRTWDTSGGNCRLTHDITEPYSSSYKVTKFLEYDAFGNIRSRTTTGVGMPSRAVSVNWGTTGQFPTQTVNALLQATTATWDPALGTKRKPMRTETLHRSIMIFSAGEPEAPMRTEPTLTIR